MRVSLAKAGQEACVTILVLAFAVNAHAQMGRSQDWNTFGSDPGRTGFERSDPRISKESVAKEFALLYKMKLEANARGQRSVTPPMIINTLISYRGFKELAFAAGSDNNVYSINADFGKMFWHKALIYSSELPQSKDSSQPCSSGVTARPIANPSAGVWRGPRAVADLLLRPGPGRQRPRVADRVEIRYRRVLRWRAAVREQSLRSPAVAGPLPRVSQERRARVAR